MAQQAPSIDPKNTWVISDPHFGHTNIVGFCHRPTDHDTIIMEEWARSVPEDGTVLCLGDLSWKNNSWFEHMIAPHLTGAVKLLIKGNHDRQRPSFYRKCGFKIVPPFKIDYESSAGIFSSVSFSHYPFRRGEAQPPEIRVHGHIHNQGYGGKDTPFTPFARNQINVSVEQTHYQPINLAALLDGYIDGCYEPDMADSAHEAFRDD